MTPTRTPTDAPARRTGPARFAAAAVMAALVVLAGAVLVRPVPQTTTPAVVTAAGPARVCLALTGGTGPGGDSARPGGADLCLDAEHVRHLALTRFPVGACVDVQHAGTLVVAEALSTVSPC